MGYGFMNMTDKNGELIFENSSLRDMYRKSMQSTTEVGANGIKMEKDRKSSKNIRKDSESKSTSKNKKKKGQGTKQSSRMSSQVGSMSPSKKRQKSQNAKGKKGNKDVYNNKSLLTENYSDGGDGPLDDNRKLVESYGPDEYVPPADKNSSPNDMTHPICEKEEFSVSFSSVKKTGKHDHNEIKEYKDEVIDEHANEDNYDQSFGFADKVKNTTTNNNKYSLESSFNNSNEHLKKATVNSIKVSATDSPKANYEQTKQKVPLTNSNHSLTTRNVSKDHDKQNTNSSFNHTKPIDKKILKSQKSSRDDKAKYKSGIHDGDDNTKFKKILTTKNIGSQRKGKNKIGSTVIDNKMSRQYTTSKSKKRDKGKDQDKDSNYSSENINTKSLKSVDLEYEIEWLVEYFDDDFRNAINYVWEKISEK